MKVIICGSRKLFLEPIEVEQAVILSGFEVTELVCGMAVGVDLSAWNWATWNKIKISDFPYLRLYGKLGGHMRNQQMVDYADAWIGITHDSELTKGTKDCYDRAKKKILKMYLHNINGLMAI
jgi:hypothetical protein